jgi:hypothetical protein
VGGADAGELVGAAPMAWALKASNAGFGEKSIRRSPRLAFQSPGLSPRK